MSVLIALKYGDAVWWGSDRGISDGRNQMFTGLITKWKCIELAKRASIVGSCGDLRFMQIVYRALSKLETKSEENLYDIILNEVVPILYKEAREYGFLLTNGQRPPLTGCDILFAFEDGIFSVGEEFAVVEHPDCYAIGCTVAARASLFSTEGRKPRKRIELALRAAQILYPGLVHEPFDIFSVPEKVRALR